MQRSDRHIRIAAALIATAGLGACALAILSDALGVGTSGSGRGFGSSQIALLVIGLLATAVGGTAFARPQIVAGLISWWKQAEPEDREIRGTGIVVLVAGLGACALAILSDALGVGTGGSGEGFGWKQISLLIAGGIAIALGILLLARPQSVSRVAWRALRRKVKAVRRNLNYASQGREPSTPAGEMSNLAANRVLLAGIAIAIAVNVIQFKEIEDDRASYNYHALQSYDTDDLFEIAVSSYDSSALRVGPFHYLGELFPESLIVVPDGGVDSWFTFESAAVAFGEATTVQEAFYDPEEFIDLTEIDEYRIDTESFVPDGASTRETIDGRVSFYANGEPSGIVVVLTPEGPPDEYGPIAFVDGSVLDVEGVPIPTIH